jgi:aspartyl-tRNA(Asn)/glutamyl-tRNA(Gln) amidotransferase subunit A
MIAFASSLDQGGVLAKSAEDAAIMLQVMAGFDNKDSTSMEQGVPDYRAALNDSIAGLSIGIPKEYFGEGLNDSVRTLVEAAVKQCEGLGAKVKTISLPHTKLAIPTYYVIAPAECSANLSRFDGVRYGHRCANPENLEDLYRRSRSEGFGEEVKRRILVGTYALSAGYYDAYYRKAQKVRRLIRQDFLDAFAKVDIIAGPTAPSPAFELGANSADPVAMYLQDIYTIPASLAGIPGMSIPCGFAAGKPVGLQLLGRHFSEATLLNLAHQFQINSDFHRQSPFSE